MDYQELDQEQDFEQEQEQTHVAKAPKKKKLTQKQLRDAAKKRRRNNFSSALAVFIVFLGFFLVFSLITVGFIYYSFHNTAKKDDTYTLKIVYDENVLHTIEEEDANNEYGLYVPFEYLAEISSLGLAGEGDNVTMFIIGTDNRIKCAKNSSLVVINDNPIRISSPILYKDGDYLIPVSLLENYIKGVDVTYDKEKMVCSISSDVKKSDISLSILLPDSMAAPYFPESYKYYDYGNDGDNSQTTPPDIP